jgi:molecular chaperone GrpE
VVRRQARVPIRVIRQDLHPRQRASQRGTSPVTDAAPPVVEAEQSSQEVPASQRPAPRAPAVSSLPVEGQEGGRGEDIAEMWRDRALRLEAEIDNFRKRQRRLAEEHITADREQLLRGFLVVADDLARALSADTADAESLRQGVDLTLQGLMRLLDQHGVESVPAEGTAFDPKWHEAVGTVSHAVAGVEPDTVVKTIQPGYRLGERLLRPARVVVAT